MMRSTSTLGIAGLFALVLASPAVAAAHTATEPRYATVEIDTSDVGEEGPVLKRRTRERTDVVLRAANVLPGRTSDDPLIHVDIDEITGSEPGYQCEVWISRADVVLGERRRVECMLCTETEIVQRVETTVSELVVQLDVLLKAEEPEPDEPVAEPDEPEPTTDPVAGSPAATRGRKASNQAEKSASSTRLISKASHSVPERNSSPPGSQAWAARSPRYQSRARSSIRPASAPSCSAAQSQARVSAKALLKCVPVRIG